MKRLITSIAISITILTGCVGPKVSISPTQIGESPYDVEQEGTITWEALEKELQDNNIKLVNVSEEGSAIVQYHLRERGDDENIIISVDTVTSPDNQFIKEIQISDSTDLSQNFVTKIVADIMGEERLLTWVAEQENQVKESDENDDIIDEVLPLGRYYVSFEYWPGSERKTLNFVWTLKPHISTTFEEIASQLEDLGMITTGYIKGQGGETLIATNSDYYLLTKRNHYRSKPADVNMMGQGATYRIMHDSNSGDYSVQLYGYMKEDLSYTTKVEIMPGLDQITQLMKMDHEDFLAITGEINKELTEVRKLQNYNIRSESYIEGEVGGYSYTISVPPGNINYKFTVLIKEK